MTTHERAPSALTLSPSMPLPSFKPCSPVKVGALHTGESSQPLPPLLPPSLGARQAEMVERLRQLMAWQERQKAFLLKQQQEEIIRLHRQGQECGDGREQPSGK